MSTQIPTDDPQANLFAALRGAFPDDLDEVAIETDDGLLYTWRDLDRATAKVANLLRSFELGEGERVMAQVEKSVEALVLYLATLRTGLVYVPLNPAYQSAEMTHFIADAQPSVLVCLSDRFSWLSKMAFTAGTRIVLTLNDDRTGSLLERAAPQPEQHPIAMVDQDAVAAIIYTSGTTGRSKGAMLSHGNLLSNAVVLKDYWGWRTAQQGGDVLIHALPIFHVHGLFVAVHGALLNGSKMIWMAKFDAKKVIQRLPDATLFMGVPTLYVRLLAEPTLDRTIASSMRLFISGSAPLLMETFRAWQSRLGQPILERYGMSETLMLTSNPYHSQDGERRGGTVGRPLPGVALCVRDHHGEDAATGQVGDLMVKGPSVFKGYWRLPAITEVEFGADGFFRTGDLGRVDGDGYVTIVGRSKDLIISGGFNVYPVEVEACINEIPGVAESAVVGVPHTDFGEVGVAVVVAKPGVTLEPGVILQHLKTTLANFKVPKRCVVVPELPRNAMGKVQKNKLREAFSRE